MFYVTRSCEKFAMLSMLRRAVAPAAIRNAAQWRSAPLLGTGACRWITAGEAVRLQRKKVADKLARYNGRMVESSQKELPFSPKRVNLLARQIRRLTVEEALVQMQFSNKRPAEKVHKAISVSPEGGRMVGRGASAIRTDVARDVCTTAGPGAGRQRWRWRTRSRVARPSWVENGTQLL
jgi:ribosomal protein L22